MTDIQKLKAAALAATPGPWVAEQNNLFWYENGYTKHLMETDDGSDICHDAEHPANLAFIAAANPAAVLELITRIENLKQQHADLVLRNKVLRERLDLSPDRVNCHASVVASHVERDQLKAENEALRTANANLTASLDTRAEEWLAVRDERDQLNAENETLHAKIDRLVVHCPDGECATCGEIICPHGGAMHFHHDGCPSCAEHEALAQEPKP